MELKIDTKNLAFLDGFLNALSLVAGDLHQTTMTAIMLNDLPSITLTKLIDFYEIDGLPTDFSENKVPFYEIEKVFQKQVKKSPLNSQLNDDKRLQYLSYKFMDYLCFSFVDYHDNIMEVSDLQWQDFQVKLTNQSARFLALSLNDSQTLLITFWQKSS